EFPSHDCTPYPRHDNVSDTTTSVWNAERAGDEHVARVKDRTASVDVPVYLELRLRGPRRRRPARVHAHLAAVAELCNPIGGGREENPAVSQRIVDPEVVVARVTIKAPADRMIAG